MADQCQVSVKSLRWFGVDWNWGIDGCRLATRLGEGVGAYFSFKPSGFGGGGENSPGSENRH